MISKIEALENFGIFKSFKWNGNIPDFSRYNLIYGWNRSGKTTLSRLLSLLEKGSLDCKEYPENSSFSVLHNKKKYSQTNINIEERIPVRVFNTFFIEDNLSFDNQNKSCKPILYISEEDIENKEKLDLLKIKYEKHKEEHEKLKEVKDAKLKEEDSFRGNLSKRIRDICNYKQSEFTKAHLKYILDNQIVFDELSDKYFTSFRQEITKEAKKKCEALPKVTTQFEKIVSTINPILSKSIISKTIDRLKGDQELNSWVKSGFEFHKTRDSKDTCFFCEKPLEDGFLASLSDHFSKDYDDIISEIDRCNNRINQLKCSNINVENYDLYSDLTIKFNEKIVSFNDIVQNLNQWICNISTKLQQKKDNPFIQVSGIENGIDYFEQYNEAVSQINEIISQHNKKVENHSDEVQIKKKKLRNHLIKKEVEEKNYFPLLENIKVNHKNFDDSSKEIVSYEGSIKELENKNSSIGTALGKINSYIRDFFGSDKIQLEQDKDKKGYVIKRYNEGEAKNLSEGERTAIAFSYFITKIEEKDFDLRKGVVYIDDPISSLDSNFIYHCYSLIKNHFVDGGQLFISTHNFELFSLLKRWFVYLEKDHKKKPKADRTIGTISRMYTIKTSQDDDNIRVSNIQEMEDCLKSFGSEYHYLFFKINNFLQEEASQESYYIVGNIARRFLEIFLNFKIPNNQSMYTKCNDLKKRDEVDNVKVDKVLKLVNDYSHNDNLDGLIKHADKEEGRQVVQSLLDVVESVDKDHYDLLQRAIG